MAGKEYDAPEEVREHVSSVVPRRESVFVDHEMTSDEATLVALGYKQEFKREFSIWTSFAVSFSVLGLLPSTASTLYVYLPVDWIDNSTDSVMPVPVGWFFRL
jgi:hypothetical protein